MSAIQERNTIINLKDQPFILLDPDEIYMDEATNVRPYSVDHPTSEDTDELLQLGEEIAKEGQIQPILVTKHDDETNYRLVAGRRRFMGVQLYNMAHTMPIKLKATVIDPMAALDMLRIAAHENIKRKQLTPMDFTGLVANTRKILDAKGNKGAVKVAEFLGVSKATVTEYEKLATLPDDVKVKIHLNELSSQDGLRLARILEAEGEEGLRLALQDADEAAGVVEKGKGTKKAAKGAKAKAIKKAAGKAKLKKDPNASTPRSKSEILEFFEGQAGPANGHPNGAVHVFVRNLTLFAAGEITERTLDKYFSIMVEKADRGKAEPVVEAKGDGDGGAKGKGRAKAQKK